MRTALSSGAKTGEDTTDDSGAADDADVVGNTDARCRQLTRISSRRCRLETMQRSPWLANTEGWVAKDVDLPIRMYERAI